MNWYCNSTITANADIAGPGVIASFVLVAWITMFVATILAFFDLLEFLSRAKRWNWRPFTSGSGESRSLNSLRRNAHLRRISNSDRTALLHETSSYLLGPLCDLQIVTGLAIVIAGLAQIPTISFYHESLAISYWWLTLNSFWAARIEYMNENTVKYTGRATIRRIGVLVSVGLGLTFQSIINVRESQDWVFLRPEYCYISHDHTSNWVWVVGTSIYAVSLVLIIVPTSRPWVHQYQLFLRHMQGNLVEGWKKCATALQKCCFQPITLHHLSLVPSLLRVMFRMTHLVLYSLCLIIYWLLLQFIAVWSFGDGFYPLLIPAYLGFAIWETFDILDLKLSNRSLIDGQENSWGFGQILPMVLLVTIGYNAFDAFKGKILCPDNT